ncbi:cupin domain-containing protein [Bordetella sp. 02P26C-1]|uniref:cupin domain-containing protein n=1 Tax=Bordetella sp. 02P26C-1 TaxID=2683195 RepID=UPI001352D60D|nr:cupin domain-containing protein [Bordetella sp. 02P26C-1]MVW79087.1 DUF861 domain-containing protein [Bordetella sp. 02P26C-1]
MSKTVHDIKVLGPGMGDFTRLNYGMEEGDWCITQGTNKSYVVGWWEGKVGMLDFPETSADEAVWLVEGKIALTDTEGGRIEFSAGQGYLLPRGFAGRWETISDAKKLYVLLMP